MANFHVQKHPFRPNDFEIFNCVPKHIVRIGQEHVERKSIVLQRYRERLLARIEAPFRHSQFAMDIPLPEVLFVNEVRRKCEVRQADHNTTRTMDHETVCWRKFI